MAIRLGAAEASDARMTWPTTFRLLVREEDREPPILSHREREIVLLLAVPDAAPAPGDDVVLADARSQLSC